MIKISNPQEQLRSNRNLLALVGGSSTVIGLLIWSSSPFLFPNQKDKVNISLRYLSLFVSTCCGISAIATGHQLQRITPLLKAVEQAEKADFISQLATSQWVQEQRYQSEAVTALQPSLQQPVITHNGNSSNGYNDAVPRDNEVSNELPNEVITAERPSERASEMEDYKPIYSSIIALKEQGMSDSDIIKDVLKLGGANYQAGKQTLTTLLQLGQSQGW